jgi:hypothetical protein
MMPIQMASRSFSLNHFDKRIREMAAAMATLTLPDGARGLILRLTHLVS